MDLEGVNYGLGLPVTMVLASTKAFLDWGPDRSGAS